MYLFRNLWLLLKLIEIVNNLMLFNLLIFFICMSINFQGILSIYLFNLYLWLNKLNDFCNFLKNINDLIMWFLFFF